MTTSTPNLKPGDHVRLAVEGVIDADGDLAVGNDNWFVISPHFGDCDIEVVVPPPPTAHGTVVLDRNGKAWQLAAGFWRTYGRAGLTHTELVGTFGPLTVIHEPTP